MFSVMEVMLLIFIALNVSFYIYLGGFKRKKGTEYKNDERWLLIENKVYKSLHTIVDSFGKGAIIGISVVMLWTRRGLRTQMGVVELLMWLSLFVFIKQVVELIAFYKLDKSM